MANLVTPKPHITLIQGGVPKVEDLWGAIFAAGGTFSRPAVSVTRLGEKGGWSAPITGNVRIPADLTKLLGNEPSAMVLVTSAGALVAESVYKDALVACQGEVASPAASELLQEIADGDRVRLTSHAHGLATWFAGRLLIRRFFPAHDVTPEDLAAYEAEEIAFNEYERGVGRPGLVTVAKPRPIDRPWRETRSSEEFLRDDLSQHFDGSVFVGAFVDRRERAAHLVAVGGQPLFVGDKDDLVVYSTSDRLVQRLTGGVATNVMQDITPGVTATLFLTPNT